MLDSSHTHHSVFNQSILPEFGGGGFALPCLDLFILMLG